MQLTETEEALLAGKYGPGRQKAMEILVGVGDVFEAPNMVPVSSSHLVIPELQLFHSGDKAKWGMEITRRMLEGVEAFVVPTTTNALILDLSKADSLRIPRDFSREMTPVFDESMAFYERKHAIPNYSCTPYFDFLYRFGEHLGGAESIQVLFNNSVNGARVNRETGPTALAVAVTGVTPNYGMHLTENRAAQVVVEFSDDVNTNGLTDADLNAIGYYAGKICVDRIPLFRGLPDTLTHTELKYLCVPLAVSAGIPMIHVLGVTPEAQTMEQALQGKNPLDSITITRKEILSIYDFLNTATSENIDYIAIGCPHCSLKELYDISRLLDNKRVSPNVIFFISVSKIKYRLAEEMGIIKWIEDSGAVVVSGMCPGASIFGRYGRQLGVKTVATNSAKNAHYINAHSGGAVKTFFGSTRQCIASAISGKWET
jgi:predicted aconitase